MHRSAIHQWTEHSQKILPFITLLISLVLEGSLGVNPFPGLCHGVLYYWSVYRPDLISLMGLFVLSILFDGFMGQNLGITFLQFLLIYSAVLWQRRCLLQASFFVVWLWFVICLFLFCSFLVGLDIFFSTWTQETTHPLIYSFLWISLAYPCLSYGLSHIQQLFLES